MILLIKHLSVLFGLSNIFGGMSPCARATKAKINKWNYINLNYFCIAKETINKTKWQSTEGEKIFVYDISDKRQISKIYF